VLTNNSIHAEKFPSHHVIVNFKCMARNYFEVAEL